MKVSKRFALLLLLLDVALVVCGAVLVIAGIAQWSTPAAYIVAGLIGMALGLYPPRPARNGNGAR